jgi:hypothetical protein
MSPTVDQNSWKPTKKWFAALGTGAASIAAVWIESGAFDDTEKGMLGTLLVALAGAYFKGNDATASGDGVPS